MNCTLHDVEQKSLEWHRLRRGFYTASAMGEWIASQPECKQTVTELRTILSEHGIPAKSSLLRPDLLKLCLEAGISLPKSLSTEEKKAREKAIRKKAAYYTSPNELLMVEKWESIQIAKYGADWTPDRETYQTARGNDLEELARREYENSTGHLVREVGFLSVGLLGLSPDGLVLQQAGETGDYSHGLELKDPDSDTWDEWAESPGVVPADHVIQVQHSLAVTGLPRWDFCAWHPDRGLFIVEVYRSPLTELVAKNLRELERDTLARIERIKSRLGKETP